MKIIYYLFVSAIIFFTHGEFASAQVNCDGGRYFEPNFTVDVTSNITYGANDPILGGTQSLELDFYEPVADTASKRPLIILAFGGSFIFGLKESPDMVWFGNYFASLGYTVASIEYRLGMFPINQQQAVMAVMRAAHDMRAAIRFFRKDAETDNNYRIEPELIMVGGTSAGAITAIHVAYLDKENEIPDVIWGDTAGIGGIEGLSGNPGYSSEVAAVINFSGAVKDTNFIEPDDPPIVSLHGTDDGTVPYGTNWIEVTGIPIDLIVDGSATLHQRMDNLGIENAFYTWYDAGHVPFFDGISIDDAYIDTTANFVRDFLGDWLCAGSVSVEENPGNQEENIHIFPNPASSVLNVSIMDKKPGELYSYNIFDVTGRRIRSGVLNQYQNLIEIRNLSPGTYEFIVNNSNQVRAFKMLVGK